MKINRNGCDGRISDKKFKNDNLFKFVVSPSSITRNWHQFIWIVIINFFCYWLCCTLAVCSVTFQYIRVFQENALSGWLVLLRWQVSNSTIVMFSRDPLEVVQAPKAYAHKKYHKNVTRSAKTRHNNAFFKFHYIVQ